VLAEHEASMRACDGIICTTRYIATRYRAFNANVWVCENGLDLGRYALTRREHETVTIGWSGGTGHRPALTPWLRELAAIMDARPNTRFMTVGDWGYVAPFIERFGPERAIELGWTKSIEVYPAAMANFDIALAPATNSAFYRGKSDLRWLESAALGIPAVCDPFTYADVEDGVTGFHARTTDELRETLLRLIDDPALRRRVGGAAREHVRTERSATVAAQQWAQVLREVAESRAVAATAA
jgi:glycosyltransferase involved in cell wall biosynthesis